jgi:LacI family transcriptional regulator
LKRATIKDIALKAGVNISTVSRALSDHPDVGADLRSKIKRLAEELNYHPNMMAVQLRKRKSNIIGLIIPETYMFFFPSVIKGISDVVQEFGYRLLVLQSGEKLEREIENVRICYENGVDGLLMTLTNKTKELHHLDELKEVDVPIVLLDKVLDDSGFDEVVIDDIKAAETCTEYLINTGCKHILGLFGNPNLMITSKRMEGFFNIIQAHEAQGVKGIAKFVDDTFSTWRCVDEYFETEQPDGIFAMSDEIIAGVIASLKKMKVPIPEECAVLGISDGYLPQILDPQVSYLHHDGYTLGKMAAQHLIKRINNKSDIQSHEYLILPTELIIKDSTRKL